jgi:uncharacterized protein (DUF58 family)
LVVFILLGLYFLESVKAAGLLAYLATNANDLVDIRFFCGFIPSDSRTSQAQASLAASTGLMIHIE